MKTKKIAIFVLSLVAVLGCMGTMAFAETTSNEVPSNSATNSNALNQTPKFKQLGGTSNAGSTTVKLSWEISDIEVTYASSRTWDADALSWVETKEVASIDDAKATFTLTSSKAVKAEVKFEPESALEGTLSEVNFTNNPCTLGTEKQEIGATLTFNTAAFASLDAVDDATTYGTYTISISAVTE